MQDRKYLIYWKPKNIAQGQPEYEVLVCDTLEQAFLESVRLREWGTEIRIFQEIKVKVELIP